ncbi:hypothetical protein C7B65_03330 [Phormidesmis priestleyi ULC007]|uniref:Uncharacterized protein n=1 Tax=Phormidesmis priestleyi ULC007 TaxID=1920490 RepID=A0A2T1DMA2_9CYAN|nr:hypothetical protein [Phormidesmis priestleyi]PSB21628.1 hypothetical protein C7B65_03330 [Phormidesmis priestleyi ULC007]PZO54669.1 MAG: hypothetical protein DCF14_01850 [Phormidesmis priestleyi]
MKVSLQLLSSVLSFCLLSASAIVAQPKPINPSQSSTQPSTSLTQQDKAIEDKIYRTTREEVDRLKKDNKDQVELYIQNKVNEKFTTSVGSISLIASLVAVLFGSTAGLVLADRWKKEFKEEYMRKTGDDIEKTRKTIINLQKETVALFMSLVLPTYSTLSFEESVTPDQKGATSIRYIGKNRLPFAP